MGYPTDEEFERARERREPPGAKTSPNTPEPPPTPSEYPPAWPRVIELLDQTIERVGAMNADPHTLKIVGLVRADMLERDQHGREKYGQPIRGGNGRRHLIDMYQEKLDAIVYAQSWLDEHGIDPLDDEVMASTVGVPQIVLRIFSDTITHVIALRGLIESGN